MLSLSKLARDLLTDPQVKSNETHQPLLPDFDGINVTSTNVTTRYLHRASSPNILCRQLRHWLWNRSKADATNTLSEHVSQALGTQ